MKLILPLSLVYEHIKFFTAPSSGKSARFFWFSVLQRNPLQMDLPKRVSTNNHNLPCGVFNYKGNVELIGGLKQY